MKNRIVVAIIWTLAFSSSATLKAQERSVEFDGSWTLNIECPTYHHAATPWAGWILSFPVTIKDGMMDGKLGPEQGLGGSHHVYGPVDANGVAKLAYDGTRGNVAIGVRGGKFHAQGTPYQFPVEAKFSGKVGEGMRRAPLVTCKVRFDRL
jgi:hypothetical protein